LNALRSSSRLARGLPWSPTKWKILRGKLPRGVRFDKKLGVFLGTPRREGTYRVTVQVVDALGVKFQKSLSIVVTA
jgi:hypothetical protein